MRRRAVLAALATGLAGCSALGDSGVQNRDPYRVPDDDTTTAEPTTTTTTTTVARGIRDPGVETVADLRPPGGITRAVDWSVGQGRRLVLTPGPAASTPGGTELSVGFTRPATRDAPARVWVGLENVSDRERSLEFGPTPPFSGYEGEVVADDAARTGLLLVPVDDRNYASYDYLVPSAPSDECWRASSPAVGPVVRSVVDLPPGHGIAGHYVALAPIDALRCLPRRGTVAFGHDDEGVGFAVAVWRPDDVAPDRSRFDRTVPGMPGFERTVWYHEAGPEARVYLAPRSERLELPSDGTSLSLRNYSAAPLAIDALDWGLYKFYRGAWHHVAPWILPSRAAAIPVGGARSLSLVVDGRPDREFDDADVAAVSGLGGGLYAVRYGGSRRTDGRAQGVMRLPADDPVPAESPAVAYAALVVLGGTPVEVTPTPDVRETSRSGATLTVAVGDPTVPVTLVLRRAPDREPALELIPEQVLQVPALRDAFAHASDDLEAVRVVTDEYDATEPLDRFAPGADGLVVRYRGTTYRLTVE